MSNHVKPRSTHQIEVKRGPKPSTPVESSESEDEMAVEDPVLEYERRAVRKPLPVNKSESIVKKGKLPPIAATTKVKAQQVLSTTDPIGFVYVKTGKRELYQTPSKKYYFLSDGGKRSYVTDRVESQKLSVYDS